MQNKLWVKLVTLLLLTLGLSIPIGLISSVVEQRADRQRAVLDDIATSSAGPQKLLLGILAVPYTEQWNDVSKSPQTGTASPQVIAHTEQRFLYIAPEQLMIDAQLNTEVKQRGLFKARTYVTDLQAKGHFRLPPGYDLPTPQHGGTITLGTPFISVALSDVRGVLDAPGLKLGNQNFIFEQDLGLTIDALRGMRAPIDQTALPANNQTIPFEFNLKIQGVEHLEFIPTGKQTYVEIHSAWPHPSFFGRFLPDPSTQQISADGFRAKWSINALATNVMQTLKHHETSDRMDSFGIRLMEPIDIYALSDRAIKYGFLFVCLTFAAIYLFELLKDLAIHPAQYGMIGMALAMFFLLLVSLSEHIDFAWAYVIASSACVSIIGVYLGAVLRNSHRGWTAGALLAVLFASLYGLLKSEDNALLMGSVLLFALLSMAMLTTRKLDWYSLSQRSNSSNF